MSRLIRNNKPSGSPEPQSAEILPLTSETIIVHLKRCQAIAGDYSRQAFRQYLLDLDESFNVAIDNARSNQEVTEFSGIQRLFRRNRQELERYYCGYIAEGFVKFSKRDLHTELGPRTHGGNELSLLDNEELEETITLSSIVQKMDTEFAEPVWALNQRFAILNGGEQVTEISNPATPIQLCESLRRALRLIPLTSKTKAIAYRTYEQKLTELVQSLVEDINQYLRKAGVLPNLKYMPSSRTPKRQEQTSDDAPPSTAEMQPEPQPTQAGQSSGPAPDPSQPSEQYQSALLQAIRGLQQNLGGGRRKSTISGEGRRVGDGARAAPLEGNPAGAATPASSPAGAATVTVSGDQLLAALQSVQVQGGAAAPRPGANEALSPVDMSAVLDALMLQLQVQSGRGGESGGGREQFSSSDMQTIDLVGMLFEYMLKDENLPDSVKALLSYLHTPFLKLAFIDPGFFEQPEHPARMLLNSLAEAGTRWIGNDGSVQFDMYHKIKHVVDSVLRDFKNDVRVIAELLLEFNSYTKSITRRQELMEKRATERAQGEERLREVKLRVNEAVSQRTENRELPSAVLLFLLQPWSDYMSFALLRYGDKSERWSKALGVVDDLLWAIEPKVSDSDIEKQDQRSSALKLEIQTGFETIGYDQAKGATLVDAISSLIEMARQSKRAEPAPAPMRDKLEKIAAEKAGQQPESKDRDISEEEAKIVDNLTLVEFGTWFEFEGGKRLKIAWYNGRTSHYMLVDQMGKQVAMMSGLEIARKMIAKQAKIIAGSSKPFFERALENIFQKLNAQAEAQSGGTNGDQ